MVDNDIVKQFERIPGLVSIVVANRNCGPFVREALDSLVDQTYKNIEIIVVDDESTDGSGDIVDEWRRSSECSLRSDRFVHLRLPRRVRQSGAATAGMFMARGEFITFQSADDLSHPQRIEKQINYLRENPEVEMLGTNYAGFIDGQFHNPIYVDWLAFGRDEIRRSYERGHHCMCDGTVMIRGPVFDRLGGWTRRLEKVSDVEFISRYIMSGRVVAEALQEVLYYYRSHPGQTTGSINRGEYLLFSRTPGLVSIVLTSYNCCSSIQQVLTHLQQQTYENHEFILVDDGSTDGTSDRIEEWLTETTPSCGSNKVVYVKLPRHVGYAGATTLGFFLTSGEFIAVNDADGFSDVTRLAKQVEYFGQHADVHLLGTFFQTYHDKSRLVKRLSSNPTPRQVYLPSDCISLPTVMFRGEIFDKMGGLTRRIPGKENLEFTAKCIVEGYNVDTLPEVLCYVSRNRTSS